MMLRCLILTCLILCSSGTLRAEENYMRDSLLLRLTHAPHDETRLKLLADLVTATQENLTEAQKYNQQLLDEATSQHNDYYRCDAYFSEIIFAYNNYDQEKLQELTDLMIPIARKGKHYDLMFRAWRCKIDFMILTQDFERNEQAIGKMLAEAKELNNETGILEAYQCYANIYRITHRTQEAIQILEQADSLATKINNINDLTNVWQHLLSLYIATDNRPKWIDLLDRADRYLSKLPPGERQLQELIMLVIDSSYTEYYTRVNNLERAQYYMLRCQKYRSADSSPLYMIVADRACALYYFAAEQYALSLEYVDAGLKNLKSISSSDDYNSLLGLKAQLLLRLGHPDEAIQLTKEVISFKDSVHILTLNKQYEQLKRDYQADQLFVEEAEVHHRLQIGLLLLLVVGFVAFVAFICYLLRTQRTLRNAEQQMRVMNQQMNLVNEAKNRFLSNISSTIREPLNTVVDGSLRLAEHQIANVEEEQQLSSSIRKMSAKLLKMINDILDLSRLEAGMMKFDTTDVEATTLFVDAVHAQENGHDKIEVVTEYPQNTLYMVQLDGARLLQIFGTLLVPAEERLTVQLCELASGALQIKVIGSELLCENPGQEIIIRNEINRMLIARFGGTYTITDREIVITLPVIKKISPANE